MKNYECVLGKSSQLLTVA